MFICVLTIYMNIHVHVFVLVYVSCVYLRAVSVLLLTFAPGFASAFQVNFCSGRASSCWSKNPTGNRGAKAGARATASQCPRA